MIKQPYNYQLRVLGSVGWDRKEFLEFNLHVYGKDDTQIVVYNMEMWPKEKGSEKHQKNLGSKLLNTGNLAY